MHPDDIRAQFTRAMDHVDTVLREAGPGLRGVACLASPEVLVEIEATAVS